MEFLAPMTGLIAAAAAVPTLVLLYFLKLRRREVLISSTLLWQRAVRDLQVNAPFQRLRRNILLLLQLLALLAVLFALARPTASLTGGPGRRYVILIDRSASMSAVEDGETRLERAQREARVLAESLRGGAAFALQNQADQAMVIAFDAHAKVLCNFTSDKRQVLSAIDAVEPTDGPSSLAEAITVARAFGTPEGEENDRTSQERAQLVLFSDGRIRDLDEIVVQEGEVDFRCLGESGANVAVVAMQARRSYERSDEVTVFASLANFGDDAAAGEVELSVDGDVRALRAIRIPARPAPRGDVPAPPTTRAVSFTLEHPGAAVVAVRFAHEDALAGDDVAWAILEPPQKLRALLVTAGNLALVSAMKACPLARLDVQTPAQFDAAGPETLGADAYDLIVLDNHVRAEMPRNRYLVFGRPPAGIGCETAGKLGPQIAVDWQNGHAALQHVNLTNLYVASCPKLTVPADAEVLAELTGTPGIVVVRRHGSAYLLVNFDLMQSNWPFEPGFVMFCFNAVNFLAMDSGGEAETSLRVGQPITIQGDGAGLEATVRGPGIADKPLAPDVSGAYRFPKTDRAGVYTVTVPGRPPLRFAANIMDVEESDIAPRQEIVVSGKPVVARTSAAGAANREIWPYLVALALLLVCVEWVVYNLKVRL
jgi:hypothetical protein